MSKYERFVDRLFDDNNEDSIFLKDADGREIEFQNLAVVDFEESYYAVLLPLTKLEGVGEDEGLIFLIDEENDQLTYVDDDRIINGINEVIMNMLDEDDED
ncbi:MAG: DUF1292 domain-containing protein [Clostridia bacterium]|nr:DUF1292 domain-containing protein [Clostridia bacterium]